MEFIKKISNRNKDYFSYPPVSIAFLGDSITQGCFECYFKPDGNIETVFDPQNSYPLKTKKVLDKLYPKANVSIINCGISGDTAEGGLKRFDRDIKPFNPDLIVVSFGANDSYHDEGYLKTFIDSLDGIFTKVKNMGKECIYIAPGITASSVSETVSDPKMIDAIKFFSGCQNKGLPKLFFGKGMELAKKYGFKVLDMYSVWEKMLNNGVDINELLANKLNHPIREYYDYMACKLVEKIFED